MSRNLLGLLRPLVLGVACVSVLGVSLPAPGAAAQTVGATDGGQHSAGLEAETRDVARGLKCPVCQNMSVADSPSPLATQMRGIIRERLQAGESREAILAYFVARYGEEVLLEPPKAGFGRLLWWGAAAIPAGGLALVTWTVHRRRRRLATAGPAPVNLSEAERRVYQARLEHELQGAAGPAGPLGQRKHGAW